jgi:hypothetical protein
MLDMAHSIPAAGHLGVAKTLARLTQHFFWPSIKDGKMFCRSYDICQRLGKLGKPTVAPMVSIPVIWEPYKRLEIDVVGPLPPCPNGNRFILTVMYCATHFLEAIPLKEHTAPEVAKALISVFSRFGFCEEILSDQGSEFMSELMKIFLRDFNISHITATAQHPQTVGSIERFHRVLKDMLTALTEQYTDAWDECLPWVLFAYREVPVEGLGYSPFELMFGRSVIGPLGLLKKAWLNDLGLTGVKTNVLEFMQDLRERLRVCMDIAVTHVQKARTKSKTWYDKKARTRTFSVGDLVLVLLPVHTKPL